MVSNRGSFGFKNINGRSVRLTVKTKVNDKIVDKNVTKRLASRVKTAMNIAGHKGRNEARLKRHSPWLTGDLARSVVWKKARVSKKGSVILGFLEAGDDKVKYARYQEFLAQQPKRLYLFRAANNIIVPEFKKTLEKKGLIGHVIIGSSRFR
tara:strand:- start:423 stop:878 length:456 start_codon:yes stop_codon:yes gene_type:complete